MTNWAILKRKIHLTLPIEVIYVLAKSFPWALKHCFLLYRLNYKMYHVCLVGFHHLSTKGMTETALCSQSQCLLPELTIRLSFSGFLQLSLVMWLSAIGQCHMNRHDARCSQVWPTNSPLVCDLYLYSCSSSIHSLYLNDSKILEDVRAPA